MTGLRVNFSVRFWIREVQHRERIISEILSEILDRLRAEHHRSLSTTVLRAATVLSLNG